MFTIEIKRKALRKLTKLDKKRIRAGNNSAHACMHELGIPFVVTHLGSHLGFGKKTGFGRIVKAINDSFSVVENQVVLLLENTAGTKNSMHACTVWDLL